MAGCALVQKVDADTSHAFWRLSRPFAPLVPACCGVGAWNEVGTFDGNGIATCVGSAEMVNPIPPLEMPEIVQAKPAEATEFTVTTALGVPAAVMDAGTLPVMPVVPLTTGEVTDAPPMVTVAPVAKFVPVMLNVLPTVPVHAVIVGAGVELVTVIAKLTVTPCTVTARSCAPVATVGTVTTMEVPAGVPTTGALMAPIVAVAPGASPVPLMVIWLPTGAPPAGAMLLMVGAAATTVSVLLLDVDGVPPTVTTTGYAPGAIAGTTMLSWVAETLPEMGAAIPFTVAVAPVAKLVPLT